MISLQNGTEKEQNKKKQKSAKNEKQKEILRVLELLWNAVHVTLKPLCCLLHHQRLQLLHNRSVLMDSLHEKQKGQKSLFPSSFKRNE